MPPNSPDPSSSTKHRIIACAAVVLAFLLPAGVLIAMGTNRGPQFSDQEEYHLPTIRQFASQWPAFDFRSYPAAMTPGYHLLMAAVARAGGCVTAMQVATALLTAGLLATLAVAVSRRVPALDTVLLCLPVAWSQYVFTSGMYVVPHNLAWWGVLAILVVALQTRISLRHVVLFGVVFLGLVLVRQIHVWTLAPVLVAAWWGSGSHGDAPASKHGGTGWKPVARLLVVACPALLALAGFVYLWGGLAPKTQEWVRPVSGLNFAAVAMILATMGALGIFYIGHIAHGDRKVIDWRWAAIGTALGLVLALIPETTYDKDAGRWSGLWNLARSSPAIGGRSLAIVGLAALGGMVTGAMLSAQRARERWVLGTALLAFVAAHATINQAWQRYYEPMVLMVFVLAAAMTETARRTPRLGFSLGRVMLVGLALGQALLTIFSLR